MTYEQIIDGEGISVNSNEKFRFSCCGCGLVHDMVMVSEDGKPIGWAMRQNPEATEERRAVAASAPQGVSGEPAPIPYERHEREILKVIDERDRYHDMADELAAKIALITGDDIGEHSSVHSPWHNALAAADDFLAAAPGHGGASLSDERIQAVVTRAVREGRLSWLGFKADDEGRYTVPVLSPADFQFARAIESELRSIASAPGWKLAPVKPTKEMRTAGKHALKGAADEPEWKQAELVYESMLAAAPQKEE